MTYTSLWPLLYDLLLYSCDNLIQIDLIWKVINDV